MSMAINQINPIPEELRLRYLARRSKDIEDCFERLRQMDWAFFERLGHQLKGNAPSYGYEDLGRIALKIEQSAISKDLMDLERHLNDFRDWLHQQK